MMHERARRSTFPPAVRHRAQELARDTGRSLSATIAELTIRGLSQLDEPIRIDIDKQSGFPVLSFGRAITPEDVAEPLDDE